MGIKPTSRVEALLSELCERLGYCLPQDEWDTLLANPPADVDSFADAVLSADGLDVAVMDTVQRRQVTALVDDWPGDSGKGAASGLPYRSDGR